MSKLDDAIDSLRYLVQMHDRAFGDMHKQYWGDRVNEAMYRVMIELHEEFPQHYNHPGEYRPLLRGGAS